ncbi:pilus assembly protein [Actinomadura sp. NAK00032]|uniref:TadE family protein n=1 Tax=Actinomadura sp. NAK00032 TaxID=2742128 RepID=UPI00158FC71D|nr:TadE family protein [Actinomadura sp. NAK00032]QKW34162.1 pilus assembly protein [Actinomadura sp. NAK00032]
MPDPDPDPRPADRGTASVEFAALLPIVLGVVLVCFGALTASTTVERVENAARTGAREAAMRQDPAACVPAAAAALPAWLNDRTVRGGEAGGDGVSCTVRAKVPLLWRGVPLDFTVTRTATMPNG